MLKIGIEDNWKKYVDSTIQFPKKIEFEAFGPRNDHSPALELKFRLEIGNRNNWGQLENQLFLLTVLE